MKTITFIFTLFIFVNISFAQSDTNTITISGHATDFDGNLIDSCMIEVLYSNFTTAYKVYTDKDGYYSIPNVEKGKYMAIYALRPKEYPRQLKVSEEDMRLEFWAWNVIADKDLIINPHYHRLELYGTTAFKENGGYPMMMIYTRPMSLGRMLSHGKEIFKDKRVMEEQHSDISVESGDIEFKVWADDVPVTIRSIQPVEEYMGGGRMMAYLLYIDLPEKKSEKYCVFRIEGYNRAYGGEKGENVYFYELPDYK